jgi:hypothetical protein
MGAVGILPGSVSAKGFTLSVEVEVEETDETEGEGKSENEGMGLLALNLPVGWTVTSARYKSPNEDSFRALHSLPQAAGRVAESFPREAGWWWAFGSNTTKIATGKHVFGAEFDVLVPKRTKAGEFGVFATILSEGLDELPAPQKFKVELKGKKTKLQPLKIGQPHLREEQEAPKGAADKGSAG